MEDIIGKRMKNNYERVSDTSLVHRLPVAIRIDGKAFHTFTRGFKKPFDRNLMDVMQETMKYLCENIQGCVLGYTQSDEITLILVDYDNLDSRAWFDYRVQKVSSISASMTTLEFNRLFHVMVNRAIAVPDGGEKVLTKYDESLINADKGGAMFDARAFNIPKEEVTNLIYWRQADAARNSVQMAGHTYFTQKELDGKNCSDIQDMLHEQKGINWNDYPTDCKRGACCVRNGDGKWIIDRDIPIFKGEARDYIEKLVFVGE